MRPEIVEKWIKTTWVTAVIVGGITALFALYVVTGGGRTALSQYVDWTGFVSAAVILALALGVYRRSRFAAVVLFIYYLFEKIVAVFVLAHPGGILVSVVVLFIFARGVQATFAAHRLRREIDPGYRPRREWLYAIVIAAFVGGVSLTALGLLVERGYISEGCALRGHELSERLRQKLDSMGVCSPDENIIFFYSQGFFTIDGDGNLFTDERVISYESYGEELYIYDARYENILDITVAYSEDDIEDTVIQVTRDDGNQFILFVSPEDGLDSLFYHALDSLWTLGKTRTGPTI